MNIGDLVKVKTTASSVRDKVEMNGLSVWYEATNYNTKPDIKVAVVLDIKIKYEKRTSFFGEEVENSVRIFTIEYVDTKEIVEVSESRLELYKTKKDILFDYAVHVQDIKDLRDEYLDKGNYAKVKELQQEFDRLIVESDGYVLDILRRAGVV